MRTAVSVAAALALAGQPIAVSATATPAAVSPSSGTYQPRDKDERGLWMQMDEEERSLKASPLVIRDPELNAYVRSVLCRTVGQDKCGSVRIYIMRTPDFNASMAMNGVMQIYSGLLLRTQNEAQLAAVLGHEFTHFENQHSIKLFREVKEKSSTAVWLAFTGIGLLASIGLEASVFAYSRDMEREADAGGLAMMASAGYDTREAAAVWEQLREEMDATAAVRQTKSKKDRNGGMFATHPPTQERVATLADLSRTSPGNPGETGEDRYRAAMAVWWPQFLDDQLKRNDFGASDFLLAGLAERGWSPWLLYARGELYRRRAVGSDLDMAIDFYAQGIAAGGELPELWRGRGLALLKREKFEEGRADLLEYLRRAPAASDRSMIAMMAGVSG